MTESIVDFSKTSNVLQLISTLLLLISITAHAVIGCCLHHGHSAESTQITHFPQSRPVSHFTGHHSGRCCGSVHHNRIVTRQADTGPTQTPRTTGSPGTPARPHILKNTGGVKDDQKFVPGLKPSLRLLSLATTQPVVPQADPCHGCGTDQCLYVDTRSGTDQQQAPSFYSPAVAPNVSPVLTANAVVLHFSRQTLPPITPLGAPALRTRLCSWTL